MRFALAGALVVTLSAGACALAGDQPAQRVELGRVRWRRDLEKALGEARKKPAFVLFQEVPGCSTCVGFGQNPLSHNLLVEAIEDAFIPILVYNNKPSDAALLKRFGEPAWNNPVVRFLDAKGGDVIPRKDGVWGSRGTALRMIAALEKSGATAPEYLRLAAAELAPETRRLSFAMHCFWEGEARLGALDGVLKTRAAWRDGLEVVELAYDPKAVAADELIKAAKTMQCATRVYAEHSDDLAAAKKLVGDDARALKGKAREAKPSDRKFSLRRTSLRYLPLTPIQASRVNAALRLGDKPDRFLSPRQRELARRIAERLKAGPQKALEKLTRPEAIEELPDYETRLRAALKTEAKSF